MIFVSTPSVNTWPTPRSACCNLQSLVHPRVAQARNARSYFFLLLYKRSAKRGMYHIYYYETTEFDYVKCASHLAAYMEMLCSMVEFIKICMGTQYGFAGKVNKFCE